MEMQQRRITRQSEDHGIFHSKIVNNRSPEGSTRERTRNAVKHYLYKNLKKK